MTETKLSTGTVRLSRVIKAPAERIYNVFLDPDAFAKWIPPGGYTGKVHAMEPKVGGTYRMSFTSLDKKDHSTFGGKYSSSSRLRRSATRTSLRQTTPR